MGDSTLVSRFLRDGFVELEGAVAPRVAADCARLLWRETGCDPDDKSTHSARSSAPTTTIAATPHSADTRRSAG